MNVIVKHILDLIYLHDCVVIPGFGGFVANYRSADVDDETGLFSPPNKEIGFNKKLNHNDGLLYHYLTQKMNCSYHDARQMVEAFIEELTYEIGINGSYQLGELGELIKDEQGGFQFNPNKSASFLADAFGLPTFHVAIPAHIQTMTKETVPLRHLRTSTRSLVRKSLIASVGLFIGLFLVTNEIQNPSKVSMGSMSNLMEMTSNEFSHKNITNEVKNTSADDQKTESALDIQKDKQQSTTVIYHLVIASFPDENNAKRFTQKMIAKGYSNCRMIPSPGKNRVAIEHFSNRSTAFATLAKYRKIKGFKSAWLLKDFQ